MKHTLKITILLLLMFLLSQILGLFVLSQNISAVENVNGTITVEYSDTAIGERPDIQGVDTFIYVIAGVLIGTVLLLILIKLKKVKIWKVLYFFAVWMTCSITLGVFIDGTLALIICFALTVWKIFRPNVVIYNLTELLVYAGIAVLFSPLFDIFWIIILLIVISGYDMFAVWKSKHMVTMAQFQTKSNLFAGFNIQYKRKSEKIGKIKKGVKTRLARVKEESANAVLGGGDIAFPLIFAGVVMDYLIKTSQFTKPVAFLYSLIIPVFACLALTILLMKAKKDRFYPAMPFITLGCLIGLGVVLGIGFLW
jgi:presenilin-like A22 family membrane protease